jgi:hypothetical protein
LEGAKIISEFLQGNISSLWKLKLSGEPMEGEKGDTRNKGKGEGKIRENPGSRRATPDPSSSPSWPL